MSRWRALAVMVALAVAPIASLGGAAALVLAPVDEDPLTPEPDAVVALAGDRERLRVAEELADATGAELVLSWVPGAHPRRDAQCAQDRAGVLCFRPRPVSTVGEARALGALSAERGWERVVVVTSRHHVGRAGVLVQQCVGGAEVEMASATDELLAVDVLKESLGVLVGLTVQRAC